MLTKPTQQDNSRLFEPIEVHAPMSDNGVMRGVGRGLGNGRGYKSTMCWGDGTPMHWGDGQLIEWSN